MLKKKGLLAKMMLVLFICAMVMTSMSGNAVYAAEPTEESKEESVIQDIVVNTTVTIAGQYPDSIDVTVSDAAILEGLKAEDFSVAGQAAEWLGPDKLHDFTATISELSVEEDVLTLTFGEFPERYPYVDSYTVTCSVNEDLTFVCNKETTTITPIADEFEEIRVATDGEFDYNLYTPENVSKPQPIVIAFHGLGDDENLYHNKLAVAWADPDNQAVRSCYVLAPVFSGWNYMGEDYRDAVFAQVNAKVQEMIDAGLVDSNRVYVTGKSFGGASVYEYLEQYPDSVAGAIAMCGALDWIPRAFDDYEKMVDIPLWIAHATTDPTVSVEVSRQMYNSLVDAGSEVVKYTEYSDEEMTAAGVTPAMSNHSVEAVVLEDETYMEWLFAQNSSEVESVVVNTSVRPAGQCLESLEVTVSDAALLEGLTAEDFSLSGNAWAWMASTTHPFTATVSEIAVEGNVLTLTITDFTEKYFYVEDFYVSCSANSALSFTSDKISEVITPIADEFEQIRVATGGNLDYNLYTPEDTSKAQPLVITFHGFLDDDNLYQNKLAVAWADPENQAERPCYVMAPLMGGGAYYSGKHRAAMYELIYAEVQEMIKEGLVDPDRIYVVGKSFGGRAVYEFMVAYPDLAAGAIAMCGAMETWFPDDKIDFTKITEIPLWIVHATTDPTVRVEDSRNVYDTLVKAGSKVVKYTEYSDEEMAAAGVTEAMGNHSMEAVVLEDEAYMEWLFAQPLAEPETGSGVTSPVTGDYTPSIMWSMMFVAIAMAVAVERKKR